MAVYGRRPVAAVVRAAAEMTFTCDRHLAVLMDTHSCAGVEGAVVAGKLLEKSDEENLGGRLGYNAATDKFEDLVAAGVIDPVKV